MNQQIKDLISQIYEENNFPSQAKLLKLVKKENPNITGETVKKFLDTQVTEQLFKTQKNKSAGGHIVALARNEVWQIDLYDIHTWEKKNDHINFIFAVVDVFSRKLWAEPCESKSKEDVTDALMKIVLKAGETPDVIMSDNESAYKSDTFQEFLSKHHIALDMNVVNDHNALGIIDNMAKRLKKTLGIYRQKFDNPRWLDYIDKIVKNYNNSEHSAIDNITPNDAYTGKYDDQIFGINLEKASHNKTVSDLSIGDKVRVKIDNIFKKSDTPNWTTEIYTVKKVKGTNITIEDKKGNTAINKRDWLLKIAKDTPEMSKPEVVNKIIKDKKIDRRLKKAEVDRNNDTSTIKESVKGRTDRKKKVYE
jgi:hypothetical protein